MRKAILGLTMIALVAVLPVGAAAQDGFNTMLYPAQKNTVITWTVVHAPGVPFNLYFSGTGAWLAEPGSTMTLNITAIADDVTGVITLGNATWMGQDENIAKDLTLGVWGLTAWLPGLVIPTGGQALEETNSTAHAAAARAGGNYMNGTMTSGLETVTVHGTAYNCIVFNYTQDRTSFGEPQRTYLAYDTDTGVLVRANTSYSFGTPYHLELELCSITPGVPADLFLVIAGIVTGVVLVLIVVVFVRRR